MEKALSRRSFFAGLGFAGAFAWLHDSDHIAARSLRSAVSDGGRALQQPLKPDWRAWRSDALSVCWLGHATVLIDFYGVKILTDPVLFDWVGLDLGVAIVGERRLVAPALRVQELPPIDLVLLSHAHMDHLDFPTLSALPKGSHVITAPNTSDLVRGCGHEKVQEMRWGDRSRFAAPAGEIEVQAFTVKHWGARWKNDTQRGYNGYSLKREGKTLLFGGDTAMCPHFGALKGQKAVAAIMPIGSYGRGSGSHCTPEEAVAMTDASGADFLLPVHHSTFPLGKEPLSEPLARTEHAIDPQRIGVRQAGEVWQLRG